MTDKAVKVTRSIADNNQMKTENIYNDKELHEAMEQIIETDRAIASIPDTQDSDTVEDLKDLDHFIFSMNDYTADEKLALLKTTRMKLESNLKTKSSLEVKEDFQNELEILESEINKQRLQLEILESETSHLNEMERVHE